MCYIFESWVSETAREKVLTVGICQVDKTKIVTFVTSVQSENVQKPHFSNKYQSIKDESARKSKVQVEQEFYAIYKTFNMENQIRHKHLVLNTPYLGWHAERLLSIQLIFLYSSRLYFYFLRNYLQLLSASTTKTYPLLIKECNTTHWSQQFQKASINFGCFWF